MYHSRLTFNSCSVFTIFKRGSHLVWRRGKGDESEKSEAQHLSTQNTLLASQTYNNVYKDVVRQWRYRANAPVFTTRLVSEQLQVAIAKVHHHEKKQWARMNQSSGRGKHSLRWRTVAMEGWYRSSLKATSQGQPERAFQKKNLKQVQMIMVTGFS